MSDKQAARPQHPPTSHHHNVLTLVNGSRLLENRDLAAAEREVEAVLARDKSWAEAHYLLGEIAKQRGAAADAERHFRRAIQVDPRAPYLHHALGNALQDTGRIDDAVDSYRRALRLAPAMAEAWNDLGTAYYASGKHQRAAECYRMAVRHAPHHIVALENLGSAFRALGNIRAAIGAYRGAFWQRVKNGLPFTQRSHLTLAQRAEFWWRRGSTRLGEALADLALAENPSNASALALTSQIAERAGDPFKALDLVQRALRASPRDAALWARLGRLHRSHGDLARSREALHKAIALEPRNRSWQHEFAKTLAISGERTQSLEVLARLAKEHNTADTWTLLGRSFLDTNDPGPAEQALSQALAIDPSSAAAIAELARLRLTQHNSDEALALCERAIEADPVCARAHFWRGRTLAYLGKWKDARDAFREASALDDTDIASVRWLAIVLREAGALNESQTVLRDALGRQPNNFDLRSELVITSFESGEVMRAREMLEKLLLDNPTHVRAIAAMSGLLNAEGRLDQAEEYAHRALDIDPANALAHQYLGLALLKRGKYAEGWEHYEWRVKIDELASIYRRFPYPEWQGENLAGKTILVYAEQGLGDELMFASCVPDVMRQAKTVILECEPRLGAICRRSFSGCAVFPRERTHSNAWVRSLEPQPDVQIPAGSLPRHFRRQREHFPRHQGYLKADPVKVEQWRSRLEMLGRGRKVGVSWRGGLVKTGLTRRSVALDALAPVLKLPDLHVISLQYGSVKDDLARVQRSQGLRILHEQESIDDYDECAALICALDGVVSVCTSVVHLTGALGRPALVMAPFSPEWRYGMSGEEMPWYPSVRVLRQPEPGRWEPVLAAIRAALERGWGQAA